MSNKVISYADVESMTANWANDIKKAIFLNSAHIGIVKDNCLNDIASAAHNYMTAIFCIAYGRKSDPTPEEVCSICDEFSPDYETGPDLVEHMQNYLRFHQENFWNRCALEAVIRLSSAPTQVSDVATILVKSFLPYVYGDSIKDDNKILFHMDIMTLLNNGKIPVVKTETKTKETKTEEYKRPMTPNRAPNNDNTKDFPYLHDIPEERLSNVAGLYDVKRELKNIINFINHPKEFEAAGAKLPKGVLMYGPPGTGKTLLARAVAGECGCTFIPLVGSDFISGKWGETETFIKKLFDTAKKNKPCIIFIDEIDTIGRKRNARDPNGAVLTSFLNPILTSMDGFKASDGVFVMAATNKIEVLDNALLRPGRFDYKLSVPNPTKDNERYEIIDMYMNGKTFDGVTREYINKKSIGMSPAEIKSVLNDAAIIAYTKSLEENRSSAITVSDVNEAFLKAALGGNLKDAPTDLKEDNKITAWHEAGHALVGMVLGKPVNMVTIMESTTGAAGITCFNHRNTSHYSKKDMERDIMVDYAGRAAEAILLGDDFITTGASQDIINATNLIKRMINFYGMSSMGLLNLEVFGISDKDILTEAQKIATELYQKTYDLLTERKSSLEYIANELLEHNTLEGQYLDDITNSVVNGGLRPVWNEDTEERTFREIFMDM